MKRLCLNCGKRPAQQQEPYGYLPCTSCVKRQKQYSVRVTIETVPEAMKEDRKRYSAEILQRYRGPTPSLEYIKKYGNNGYSKEEVKEARNVWGDNTYYSDKTERAKNVGVKKG